MDEPPVTWRTDAYIEEGSTPHSFRAAPNMGNRRSNRGGGADGVCVVGWGLILSFNLLMFFFFLFHKNFSTFFLSTTGLNLTHCALLCGFSSTHSSRITEDDDDDETGLAVYRSRFGIATAHNTTLYTRRAITTTTMPLGFLLFRFYCPRGKRRLTKLIEYFVSIAAATRGVFTLS